MEKKETIRRVTHGELDASGEYIYKEYTQDEYIEQLVFKRIDPYHSIAGFSEEHGEDHLSGWDLKELGWKEIGRSDPISDESFPAHQDLVETIVYIDDNYTYILNQIWCNDFHVAPSHIGMVVRLDKEVSHG